ncbi:MAG: AMP-binding protein [Deltaproteobacteria bacterium]|nr:AMP-binding protein [Candidatus Anaeroferrophillus wilburensis]MBN2888839.1 AMP-binding protein [Deltaproteobacteria bacterium]
MTTTNRTTGFYDKELETATPEGWREYHDQQVKELCLHACQKAPAIKKIFADAGVSPADITAATDLEKLPVTSKSQLAQMQAENPPFGGFLTVPVNELKRIFMSPGPIYDPQGKTPDFWGWSEGFYAAGFRAKDVVINTFGYQMTPAGLMFEESLLDIGCSVLPTGVGNTETQVELMKNLGVTGFVGMASFLRKIGEKAREMGLDPIKDLKLEIGYVAAEILTDALRAEVEQMYDMTLRQGYGTADCGCLAYECRERSGMHFTSKAYVEIVDPQTGKALGPGEPGEVVVTMFNPVYPLIRFGTGDLSAFINEPCACGRTAPRLTRIMGRVDQITKVKGMFVHPSQADQVVAKFPQVAKYEIVVTREHDSDIMTFNLEMKEHPEDSDAFIKDFSAAVQEGVKLRPVVNLMPAGSIADTGKKIRDERKWD